MTAGHVVLLCWGRWVSWLHLQSRKFGAPTSVFSILPQRWNHLRSSKTAGCLVPGIFIWCPLRADKPGLREHWDSSHLRNPRTKWQLSELTTEPDNLNNLKGRHLHWSFHCFECVQCFLLRASPLHSPQFGVEKKSGLKGITGWSTDLSRSQTGDAGSWGTQRLTFQHLGVDEDGPARAAAQGWLLVPPGQPSHPLTQPHQVCFWISKPPWVSQIQSSLVLGPQCGTCWETGWEHFFNLSIIHSSLCVGALWCPFCRTLSTLETRSRWW